MHAAVAAYVAMALAAVVVRGLAGGALTAPLVTPGWLDATWSSPARLALSVTLGAALAAATLGATPALLRRSAGVRALAAELEGAVRDARDGALVALALASGVAEELLFRGALLPLLGVVGSAAVFGALHQARGRARWVWAAWAFTLGLALGGIVALTGHVAGAALAHVAINAGNLRRLRDAPGGAPRARKLGGLLA